MGLFYSIQPWHHMKTAIDNNTNKCIWVCPNKTLFTKTDNRPISEQTNYDIPLQ